MQFKIKNLKSLLSSITKHKVKKISITSKNFQLTISRMKRMKTTQTEHKTINQPVNHKAGKTKHYNTVNKEKKEIAAKDKLGTYFTIISPMIGTFYRSPGPNERPFISVNDLVKAEQTVCIIEAMKLMNEIESEVNGQIVEILVQDGDIVDCGQALMRVKY